MQALSARFTGLEAEVQALRARGQGEGTSGLPPSIDNAEHDAQ
jgi:hypothetical protein